ncbi:MAG: hypothetical protein K8L97_16365 [Anaerolineae bacterium]|nr:hypothetical protein [Anaerolineae bacterium]
MESTTTERRFVRFVKLGQHEIDSHLPRWARRSNPIIRRHLGMYWKTILPETTFLKRAFVVQAALVLLSLPIPGLVELALPAITASVLLFPFAMYLYGHVLVLVGMAAARTIADELQNGTFQLLRVTPFNLESIIASKVAAAIWRQVEDLGLLLTAAVLMSMPLLISQYASIWPLDEQPLLARGAIIAGLAVSMLRLAVEPFMIGAIGVMMGAALHNRASAVISTLIASGFYFLLLNLLRFVPLDTPLRLVVEFIFPLVLPLLVIAGAFQMTRYLLSRI